MQSCVNNGVVICVRENVWRTQFDGRNGMKKKEERNYEYNSKKKKKYKYGF